MSNGKRDWKRYNDALVRRGSFYLSLDLIDDWDREISLMNAGKRGRPYQYPEQFILFMGIIRTSLHIPYRQMEGFAIKLSQFISHLRAADYTTLFRRLRSLETCLVDSLTPSTRHRIVAVDSSGIKVTNRGGWLRHKWRVTRGWLKVHIMVDVNTKEIISLEVTTEEIGDNRMFEPLLRGAMRNGCNISTLLADGAYDTRKIHNLLESEGIDSGIKLRRNSSTRSRGSPYRARCVREFREIGSDNWKNKHHYGKRWSVETVFSAVKRIFGETVRSRTFEGMVKEVKMMFLLYNMLINME